MRFTVQSKLSFVSRKVVFCISTSMCHNTFAKVERGHILCILPRAYITMYVQYVFVFLYRSVVAFVFLFFWARLDLDTGTLFPTTPAYAAPRCRGFKASLHGEMSRTSREH